MRKRHRAFEDRGADMNADQIFRLFYHHSRSGVGYRKYPGVAPDFVLPDIARESFSHLMGKKRGFSLFSALGFENDRF